MPTPSSLRVHGQIRDTGGNPRQAYVVISTFLGPDLAKDLTDANGSYQFEVPGRDDYVIQVMPPQGVQVGGITFPAAFGDTWRRVPRGAAADLTVDVSVQPAGILFLDAYDPQGNRMYSNGFPDPSAFAIYPLGTMPVHKSEQILNRQRPLFGGWETVAGTIRNPAVLLLPSKGTDTFSVWGLWRVPEAGTIILEMDNGGLGYALPASQLLTVNVPYEFARTELRKAQQKYTQKTASGYTFPLSIASWLAEAQAAVEAARQQLQSGDSPHAAMTAYQALTPTIRAKEAIALEVARQDIERFRRVSVTVTVVGSDQQPLNGIRVSYRQVGHDFMLSGNWGGDGATLGDTSETLRRMGNYTVYAGLAKEMGLEYLNFPPTAIWGVVQRDWPSAPFRFDDDVILRRMAEDGFRASSPGIWLAGGYSAYPLYLKGLSYDEVKAAAVNFVTTVVSHYAGKIQWWNLMEEPNLQNDLGFTPAQMLDFTKTVLVAGKAADPNAVMSVLLTSPGLELGYMTEPPGNEAPINFIPTYDYLRQMLDAGIRPDAVDVQFYYGARYPSIDLGTVSDLLDVYAQDFDVPVYIEELEYPTHEEYQWLVNMSTPWTWHQGHTDQAQADWATAIYTLAFSKRHVVGANWSLATQIPAFLEENGRQGDAYLRRDALTPHPMVYALRDLFRSWTTTGASQTDKTGRLVFSGFAGEYLVTLTAPNGTVREKKIHVQEGQTNAFTIVFDQKRALADNRQAADNALDQAQRSLTWANGIGKTSGMVEATAAYGQAEAAYTDGQYWSATQLARQAREAIVFHIDGKPDDWAGVAPLYTQTDEQGRANGNQLRRFSGAMDGSYLYLLLEFDTSAPRWDILFELDTGADGTWDYHVHTHPMGQQTIFVREADTASLATALTHMIPSIDVIYDNTLEIRIPLADLGNPTRVRVVAYREDLGGGIMTTVIPSLGVVTEPSSR